jgi:hypothetical protein
MLMLADFGDQFGIAVLVQLSMIFVAAMIYVFLIKRHTLAASLGVVLSLIIGAVVFTTAIRCLM